jgi:hypothetical protein
VLISAASSEILPRRRLVPPADAPLDAAGHPRQYTALRPGRLCHFPVIGPPSATATAPAVPLAGRLACVRAKIAEVVTVSEPFPSRLCLADLQYVDGLGELAGAPGAAAELAEDVPGFELGVRALAGCPELRVGLIGLLL